MGLRRQSERHPDSAPEKGFRPERLSVFIHSGSFFWRIFPGGLSRGPAVGEDRIQERNPRGAVLVRRGGGALSAGVIFAGLRVLPSCAVCDGLRAELPRSRRESVRNHSWSGGKRGAAVELCAVVQRRGSGTFTDSGTNIHSHGRRVCAGTDCGNERGATGSVPRGRSQHGEGPLPDDRGHFRGCGDTDPTGALARCTRDDGGRRSGGGGKERGERTVSRASGERCHRSVFLRGSPGGSGELCDSVRAVLRCGDDGENGSALFVAAPSRLYGGPIHRLCDDEEDCGTANVVSFRWGCDDLRDGGFAGFRSGADLGGGAHRVLPLDYVSDDFRAKHKNLGPLTKRGSSLLVMAIIGGAF